MPKVRQKSEESKRTYHGENIIKTLTLIRRLFRRIREVVLGISSVVALRSLVLAIRLILRLRLIPRRPINNPLPNTSSLLSPLTTLPPLTTHRNRSNPPTSLPNPHHPPPHHLPLLPLIAITPNRIQHNTNRQYILQITPELSKSVEEGF